MTIAKGCVVLYWLVEAKRKYRAIITLVYLDQSVNRNRTVWNAANYVNHPNRILEFLTDSLLIELWW